jgi:hypothetical protein
MNGSPEVIHFTRDSKRGLSVLSVPEELGFGQEHLKFVRRLLAYLKTNLALLILLAAALPAAHLPSSRSLREPDISAHQIAFIYAGDLRPPYSSQRKS